MAEETNLDPRFDPAFQRGFEGTIGTTRRRPTVGTPSVLPAQQAAQGQPSQVQLGRPQQQPARALPPAPEAVAEQLDYPLDDPLDEGKRLPARGRFNPFVVALIVIAAVFIVLGLSGAQFANSVFQSGTLSTTISYATVLLAISGSAVSVGVGVATLIGVVFLFAMRWYRR